jgi:tRNA (guanine37-N1)-methyltransferase
MVMMMEPIVNCIEHLQKSTVFEEIIYMSPDGELLNQSLSNKISTLKNIIILCGHYKGIDERLRTHFVTKEISIGDYVLSGGELAALVLLDACVRLLPGVMGAAESAAEESFAAGGQDHLLEYPHYTRPAEWQGRAVPTVLLSGHHGEVARWRRAEAERITKERRPDLWVRHCAAAAAMDGRPVPA